jgi:hypothetical protein
MFLPDVLSKALAPLCRHRVAEPKLLLSFVRVMRACAADIGRLLRAPSATAPSLIVPFSTRLET